MTLRTRKLVVLSAIGVIVLFANLIAVTAWLDKNGVTDCARFIHREYVTGTAVTVILALLILVPASCHFLSRCRVCSRMLLPGANYCGHCGSRA